MTSKSRVMPDLTMLRLRDRNDQAPEPEVDVEPEDCETWPDDAPEHHRIVTSGVTSEVADSAGVLLGHVLMTEYDQVDPSAPIFDAEYLDGVSVVLRSSPACYHLWNLTVRAWDDAIDRARETVGSRPYVDEMGDCERFVLRTVPKFHADDRSEYRPTPEPVAVIERDYGRPLSRPHLTRLRQLAEDTGRDDVAEEIDDVVEDREVVGRHLRTSTYETMTDGLREVWHRG